MGIPTSSKQFVFEHTQMYKNKLSVYTYTDMGVSYKHKRFRAYKIKVYLFIYGLHSRESNKNLRPFLFLELVRIL